LAAVSIPGLEILISASVLAVGLLLALQKSLPVPLSFGLFALAGLLHGYAYGEAIVGAGMPPLLAYLMGFSLVQMALALAVFVGVKRVFSGQSSENTSQQQGVRAMGWLICGTGLALLFPQVIGLFLARP
jgi:urease accessory protein